MNDKELLELAAKAANVRGDYYKGILNDDYVEGILYTREDGQQMVWNPLTDDGDALRLAVRIRSLVAPWGAGASCVVSIDNRVLVLEPHYGDDPERATRRAIVRAAAEIGRSMK